MTVHFCLKDDIQDTAKFATWEIGVKEDEYTRNLYYLNFAPECTLTTVNPMPESDIEIKLLQIANQVEAAKEAHLAAAEALREAAAAGVEAIASAEATEDPVTKSPMDEAEASMPNQPLPTESEKNLSPRKEAGALKGLREAEQKA